MARITNRDPALKEERPPRWSGETAFEEEPASVGEEGERDGPGALLL
jgi:hypothetical protein